MRSRRQFWTAALAGAAALTSGCYESADVVLHSPGEYSGKRDSAAIMRPTEERQAALLERFRAVQTDR